MSNYRYIAFNPQTQQIEIATWIDNHFGQHCYGVKFDGADEVYRPSACGLSAVADVLKELRNEVARLQAALGDGVLVPREPTPEMLAAFWRVKNGHYHHDEPPPPDTSDYAAYRAMINAPPTADKAGQGGVDDN